MISTYENFITLLLDKFDPDKHNRLYLHSGKHPYYMMDTSIVKVAPEKVDPEELIEDMDALGMELVYGGEYYYRHILPDETAQNLRMKVEAHQDGEGNFWVMFRYLTPSQVARPSPGKKFHHRHTLPSNAETEIIARGKKG